MKDEALKTRWIEALESGQYEQGRHCLRHKNQFCCLGVLCDLMEPEGWEHPFDDLGRCEHRGCNTMPDFDMASSVVNFDSLGRLAQMNDEGSSFVEIADHIRRNF